MVTIDELRSIYLFQKLGEEILQRVCAITESHHYKGRDIVFREGDKAEKFYMLKRGKILLEVEVSEIIIISLGSVKSGYSFGWSSLFPGASYTTYAICSEPSEVLSVSGVELLSILEEYPEQGYIFMYEATRILKRRLEKRTGQFLKVMSKHPDIQKLLGL